MIGISPHSRTQHHQLNVRGLLHRARHVRVHTSLAELLLPASCVAGATGVTLSTLELLSKVAEKSPAQRLEVDKVDEDDEFSWTVVTAVSFIPGFNWLAWIMAAVSSEDGARRFYIFCSLYCPGALFTLLQFPELDKASVFLYIICALHVQVEMMSAIDQRSATKLLDSLPAGQSALLSAGTGLKKRLSALMEALDYTIERELEESSTKLPLKEQRMLEEDARLQKELRESEMSTWDDKLRKGRDRFWGKWGKEDKK